ncbi:MAG: SUMF1/EgtB/PvdO family nonheme iron enzyme, partial [candidate division Zixibacteria bacterium]|nr:formylglycine-generating enzyme family protein [candidate division Zixibacteria bacterium]NIR65898.1 formylglycine-generating enzyme family protein [candidate division Zixibacteria bacterium]NIS47547.1 formylglycine-generating enzyme family protein [candidate division Zixibacteria bacterium]NIU15190.1 formylglycine-generating enzyme family protein [candidate division Zixibacteria bacterium]NIV07794.1 SUMF1/EgtB/PvdO family nonheme iron enzyme [candidate division Zixibacteria bacterium]
MSENWEMPDMVRIPAATFTMGDTWKDGLPDEQPTYEVQIESFQLGKHAVTNRQYIMFLNDIGANTDDRDHLLVSMRENRSPYSITADSNGFSCLVEYENFPVTYVSWFGAVLFCE